MGGYIREGLGRALFLTLAILAALFLSCEQLAGPMAPPEEETPPSEPPEPVAYRAVANGRNGEEDSTVIHFTFEEDLAGLQMENISLVNGGGDADTGGGVVRKTLAGSGKEWSLGIAVQNAGTVTVAIDREGIEPGERLVTVYKEGEPIRVAYHAAADGGARQASASINFAFGAAIENLAAEDLTIAGDSGSVVPGTLSGSGQNWSLGIAVETPGTLKVGIAREDIEAGERSLTVYRPVAYTAAADGGEGEAASSKIDLSFNAGVAGLTAEDISIVPADSVAVGSLTGSGAAWTLGITALKAGDAQISIHKDGIEEGERTLTLYLYTKPIGYTPSANGRNGEEDSTAIALAFDEDVPDLRVSQITIVNGEDENGGRAVRGALSGSGKQWSLGITTEKAGSVKVKITRAGIEAGEKPVTLYKAGEQTLVGFSAAADGSPRRASSAINLSFGAAVADLTMEEITVTDDTGSVVVGALSGSAQLWSLGIAVETSGDIKVKINKAGVEAGEKTLAVYRPATYSIAADGTADLVSSAKIDFLFSADIAGLTTGEIALSPPDSVAVGSIAGSGAAWSLGITVLKPGDLRVRINKDGVEDRERPVAVHQYRPVAYTVAANGANGTEDSTALNFVFDRDLPDLAAGHIRLVNGTGSIAAGSLTGSGKNWSLGIAVETPGSVKVAIDKTGVEAGEKTLDVYQAAEQILAGYTAAADGGSKRASSVVTLNFGDAVSLAAADLVLADGTGSVAKGALSGNGKNWSLGITVKQAGDIKVKINKEGIEAEEKPLTVYKPITWEAAADVTSGAEPSGRIDLVFSEAVEDLGFQNLRFADSTGSAYPMLLSGSGQEWSLSIVTIETGDIKIGIDKDGIDETEKTLAVYKPQENPPAVAVKTGIAIISPPDTTLYALNQAFDPTGLKVGWAYSDGTLEPMEGWQLEPPDTALPVAQRVYVRAGGYTASFWIQVLNSDKILLSISATGPANKTQEFGKDFDKTGLVVTGHYSDGSTANLTNYAAVAGYDKFKRGPQAARVMVNGKTAPLEGIVVRIGSAALATINRYWDDGVNKQALNYKDIWIKGEAMTPRLSNIQLLVAPSGQWGSGYSNRLTLTLDNGGLLEEDFATLTGYNPYQTGWQTPSITIDGRKISFYVRVMDVESAVWFDYGYMRHDGDPTGHGPGTGKYYAKPNETLVIAPVRYLLGYNPDHSDAGASYSWTVSGSESTRTYYTSKGDELLHITPKTAGTYSITVAVTGKDFVSGSAVTKTATAELVCYAAPLTPGTFVSPLRNFGAGQFSEWGNGYGWSLGAAGGYEVWTVDHQPSYFIDGNPFGSWHESGVVWMQEDNNGNGLPDETWYELRGGDEDDPAWKGYITRRYAVSFFTGDGTVNQLGRPPHYTGTAAAATCWVDSKGRTGILPGGFPSKWGVAGNWVTYTCTLLRDNGDIFTGNIRDLAASGYVDTPTTIFPVNKAMRADGTPVNLTAVKFIKVQTGIFRYGASVGDISTEIYSADYLGRQTDFPKPQE